ncbi:nucleotide exchange factor GrpE [Legionella dresdenensis]|uniref:Protein GrpE n=1 Tax=Legionella dresdenensis TaxID=450200 RepID=A0ABV8CDZ5_9GAMM
MSDKNTKDWKRFKEEADQDELLSEEGETTEPEIRESALEHPDYAALEEKLTLAEQKAHENWEKSVRAVAELENVRRRAERDITNARLYGQEKIISSLLPVADSIEQALQLIDPETHAAMYEGLQLTNKLFLDVLEKNNVQQLNPLGEPFNPQEHEAMSMQEAADAMPNSVIAVFQKGYKLNDRVIRPARVIVAKAK